ncbi:MAG: hypothetical protein H7842_11795 [Gammaproteobacteria bacterium SHHR-1]|uniref:hypothetical protein n=1 Tax=Magnetovirga frankeli TaxID=947516 RepID=UPI001293DD95|nr:hypothetical protein D5125_07395 [gamma proteobacterium SS-5]
MHTTSPVQTAPAIRFEFANWTATDPLPRDQTQSLRLHEPEYRVDTIDPMTGRDIKDIGGHPYLIDGNLTIYFETEASRQAYVDMPLDHPNPRLPFPASVEDDRGG